VSYAGKEDLIESYVEALIREIQSLISNIQFPISTIYIGGGTPTLLEPKYYDKIINTIICHLSLDICHSEVSIEANPGTVDLAKLKALRSMGINRLSLGAQSFNDDMLKMLGRIHTAKEIYEAIDNARKAGFDNINLDLIFALPNQTLDQWKADLSEAIHLKSNHLSIYNLQIEENTPFQRNGYCKLSDEEELAMYEYAIEELTANGLLQYEISNFAVPGFECKHNLNYWLNGNYIGIGAGAHSHWNGKRWANTDSVEAYIGGGCVGRIGERTTSDVLRPTPDDSQNAPDQRDTLIMGLRLLDGIPRSKFNGFEKEVADLITEGLLEQANDNYRLTRHGLYLANEVFRRFV